MPYHIDGEAYLDVNEAVELLGIKPATLYAYVSRGIIHSYRQQVGRRRLYRHSDIMALLQIKPETSEETGGEEKGQTTHKEAVQRQPDDDVIRDVHLPDAASWASDH